MVAYFGREQVMSEQKFYKLHFDKDGIVQSAGQRSALIEKIVQADPPVSDLWVMSYGWDNDERGGDATYNAWLAAFKERIGAEIGDDGAFNPAFVGIYWPSRFWGEYMPPANAPDGGAYVLEGMVELEVADNPPPEPDNATKDEFINYYRLAFGETNPNYEEDFGRLYDLLARDGTLDEGEVGEFVATLQKYGQADPHPESFESENVLDNPDIVQNEVMQGQTAGQEGLGDMFRGMTQKAFFAFTFWTMKNRAGVVGEKGVATFVRDLRRALRAAGRDTKIHLMGHSFGGKVMGALRTKRNGRKRVSVCGQRDATDGGVQPVFVRTQHSARAEQHRALRQRHRKGRQRASAHRNLFLSRYRQSQYVPARYAFCRVVRCV
jgi:hypothetical protein